LWVKIDGGDVEEKDKKIVLTKCKIYFKNYTHVSEKSLWKIKSPFDDL